MEQIPFPGLADFSEEPQNPAGGRRWGCAPSPWAETVLLPVMVWVKFPVCGRNSDTDYYLMNSSTSLSSFANKSQILQLLHWVINIRGIIRM